MRQSDTRNRTVDVLKGIGILMVLTTHYKWTEYERALVIFPFIIDMAIPMFMIITGYTYSMSFERHKIESLGRAYSWRSTGPKFLRYAIPFMLIAIWEMLDPHVYLSAAPPPIIAVVQWILRGMVGHGSYYFPILIQLLLIFPVIYFIVSEEPKRGLVICFILNLIYEVLKWAYRIPEDSYRLIALRYIFVIAVGVYAYCEGKFNKIQSVVIMGIGALIIVAVKYIGYEPTIITMWTGTSFAASLWIIPTVTFLLQSNTLHFKPLEVLGKASYHIFLVQMVYYVGYCEYMGSAFSSRVLHFVVGACISIFLGLVFYYFDFMCLSGLYKKAGSIHHGK